MTRERKLLLVVLVIVADLALVFLVTGPVNDDWNAGWTVAR